MIYQENNMHLRHHLVKVGVISFLISNYIYNAELFTSEMYQKRLGLQDSPAQLKWKPVSRSALCFNKR